MILFESVSKKYRGTKRPALDRVSLNIDRGEFVFIVGASGSGKSSCLRLILREEQPSTGRVHVLGHDLGKISNRKVPYFRRNLGVVFQDFRLLTNKTVYDNVAFSLQVIGKSRGFIQEAVPDVLEMVGLGGKAKRFPHELSGGEQQRVAIARAIVNKPAILLADEPTGNLDPATSLGIMQLLRAINASGTTVVMATHEATFVDIMQQRVIELSQGVVVRDEQSGGYGETAAIDLGNLSEAGTQKLRTSEEALRVALTSEAPELDAIGDPAEPELAEIFTEETPSAAAAEQVAAFEALLSDSSEGADPAAPAAPAPTTPAAPELAAEAPSGAQQSLPDELDETVRTDRPGSPASPAPQAAPPGSYAEALGLTPDDQTDVGPVR
ncbi:cell division ATP-binding protein FtsE [Leucobacter sp. UT-8R-CII-1-4]|uniref:cell division ATP-binding protein FtsE n=1 Tax=Leucobacter sp. UT-8R-CII-1-4 TaxID=3040075 RepID=UPI0024A88160|nr:cell division ATP-binding protein FtsE [Leucobacter sp. UT-8R-CII-1-4]MDI6022103.1 cell division ATP-binding protein FtsE [Leucobacter sp. UT-8R-CII-1-4]